MLAQYNTWYNANAPLDPDDRRHRGPGADEQGAWAAAAGHVSASVTNGVVTITNGGSGVKVPVTVPAGTTSDGAPSASLRRRRCPTGRPLASSGTQTLTEHRRADDHQRRVGHVDRRQRASASTVTTTGSPPPALSETGALPAGRHVHRQRRRHRHDRRHRRRPAAAGSYPITITATNAAGTATQSFTLANDEAPAITSPATAAFSTGIAGTLHDHDHRLSRPDAHRDRALPAGLTFVTTATARAPSPAPRPPAPRAATRSPSRPATPPAAPRRWSLTITVGTATAPAITSGAVADFTLNQAGAVAITATGSPTPGDHRDRRAARRAVLHRQRKRHGAAVRHPDGHGHDDPDDQGQQRRRPRRDPDRSRSSSARRPRSPAPAPRRRSRDAVQLHGHHQRIPGAELRLVRTCRPG